MYVILKFTYIGQVVYRSITS